LGIGGLRGRTAYGKIALRNAARILQLLPQHIW
jgi:hypothetical protein